MVNFSLYTDCNSHLPHYHVQIIRELLFILQSLFSLSLRVSLQTLFSLYSLSMFSFSPCLPVSPYLTRRFSYWPEEGMGTYHNTDHRRQSRERVESIKHITAANPKVTWVAGYHLAEEESSSDPWLVGNFRNP